MSQTFAAQITERSTFLGTMAISLARPCILLFAGLLLLHCAIWNSANSKKKDTICERANHHADAVQVIPLFLLPFILLPFPGHNGWFDSGTGKYMADHFFPVVKYGQGREYWRAVRFHSRLAAVHLECIHQPADVVVVDDFFRSDLCNHSSDHLALG